MNLVFENFISPISGLLLDAKAHVNLKFLNFKRLLVFTIFFSCLTYGQNSSQNKNVSIAEQRSIMIFNLTEQVKWPNINKITTIKIGVLGTDAIKNNLINVSKNKRIYNKLIDIKRIKSLEEVEDYNVVYVNTTYEYLLKSILDLTKGKQILIITEGYPKNSSMINMVQTGDTFNYDINRMYLREANLKIIPTLASYAVSSTELKERMHNKAEEKLYVVSRENDEQKKIINNQIKTIYSQIDDINKKEEALIEKDNSLKNLYVESELKNLKIQEKINLEKVNEQKIEEQISQLNFQQEKMDSINTQIQNQQKILEEQSSNIREKTIILAKKDDIIKTQRKHNIRLTILSTLLFILSLSLLVAYIKNKKLNKRLQTQHVEINQQSVLLTSKNKELEQFAYITSHDLQEPLNTISSFIDIIKMEYANKFDTEGQEMLGFIKEGSVRMKKLIDALLQYSRLGRAKEYNNVNCMPLLDVLTEDLQSTIKSTDAEINYKNLPTIQGNELELRLLFQNLISNSLKFRKPDVKPKIDISCEEVFDETDGVKSEQKSWVFSVADNGIGIAQEYQDRVFAIFQRLHSRLEYEGSGIGLAHCKKIVEAHSGKIWFTSASGSGTTFRFSIPVRA